MKQEFLNRESMRQVLENLFSEYAEKNYPALPTEDTVEMYTEIVLESTMKDMNKYVHMDDTHIWGNFNNIRYDYNREREEGAPDFDRIVMLADEGRLTEDELNKLQEWTENWFFETFGTYNLTYNFENVLSNDEYEYLRYGSDIEQFFNYKEYEAKAKYEEWNDICKRWAVDCYEDMFGELSDEEVAYMKEHDLYKYTKQYKEEAA